MLFRHKNVKHNKYEKGPKQQQKKHKSVVLEVMHMSLPPTYLGHVDKSFRTVTESMANDYQGTLIGFLFGSQSNGPIVISNDGGRHAALSSSRCGGNCERVPEIGRNNPSYPNWTIQRRSGSDIIRRCCCCNTTKGRQCGDCGNTIVSKFFRDGATG